MTKRSGLFLGMMALVSTVTVLPATSVFQPAREASQSASVPQPIMPKYGNDGALLLAQDYRQWVFVGSSLGLSYSQGQAGMEMFHETLMEPTAYKHFAQTGMFREGTMLALILHGTGENVLPGRRGRFAAEVHGVEMAVKDSAHRPEGWAYYNFGGMNGLRTSAQAMPRESCYNCHVEHAKRDNVFLQFYPLLEEVAPRPVAVHENQAPTPVTRGVNESRSTTQQPQPAPALAIRGLDPVLLVDGKEEMGKPEIVAVHGGHRYQFVSEPNRVKFESDPQKYSIQNDTCPVVPGAPVDPSLFAVHEGKIYGFATPDCVQQFKARPSDYVKQ